MLATDRLTCVLESGWRMAWQTLIAGAFVLSTVPSFAMADTALFNIPAEPMPAALKEFAAQAHMQLLYQYDAVAKLRANRVVGEQEKRDALQRLIFNTGLEVIYSGENAATIRPAKTNSETQAPHEASPVNDRGSTTSGDNSSPNRFRVAQADQATPASSPAVEQASDNKTVRLEEITVTAEKRSEKLLDVPASISVLSGDQIESQQVNSVTDFAGYLPGLTVASSGGPGQDTPVIRGLSTGYNNTVTSPLVGIYIDDMPTGAVNNGVRSGLYSLDLLPYDIEQIELLRGPQGTLYGSNAMAGLLKYTLRKPDLTQFDTRMGADLADVNGSRNPSSGGRGSINIPLLTNTLAIRLSGFYQHNAGYINNVGTGARGADHSNESGGRATVLWKPTDGLSFQATVLAQNINQADETAVTLNATTLQPIYGPHARVTAFPEPFTQQLRNYDLTINWDLHLATLTNSFSYSRMHSTFSQDYSSSVFATYVPYPGGGLADYMVGDSTSKYTDELRLTSPEHERVQWILGGFFTKERSAETNSFPTFTPSYVPLPMADNLLISENRVGYEERALFGNATYNITSRFDISGGVRYAQYTITGSSPVSEGLFGSGPSQKAPVPYTGVSTWMGDARLHLNENSMFYVRVATGYRPGGCAAANCVADQKLQIPATYKPDKTTNYEAGLKGTFLDGRLQFDLSAFHIDWTAIQAQVINSLGLVYPGNGGTATSNGFELTNSYQIHRLLLRATLDYTDAHLTQNAAGIDGNDGNQLPESPRWGASLLAEYTQPLANRRNLTLGGGYRYRDTTLNQFVGTGEPLPMGPQSIVDLHTGLTMNQTSMRFYAKNVLDNRSYTGLLYLRSQPMFVPVQPRTIGLSVDHQF